MSAINGIGFEIILKHLQDMLFFRFWFRGVKRVFEMSRNDSRCKEWSYETTTRFVSH